MLAKSNYREATRPDGTLGFSLGRGRGRGAELLGAGWGVIPAAPPKDGVGSGGTRLDGADSGTPGQFASAASDDGGDSSEEEILMLKAPPAAAPSAPLPDKSAGFSSLFAGTKAMKKKITLRLDNGNGEATNAASAPAPAAPAVTAKPSPPVNVWQAKAWAVQAPSPVLQQPPDAAATPAKVNIQKCERI